MSTGHDNTAKYQSGSRSYTGRPFSVRLDPDVDAVLLTASLNTGISVNNLINSAVAQVFQVVESKAYRPNTLQDVMDKLTAQQAMDKLSGKG